MGSNRFRTIFLALMACFLFTTGFGQTFTNIGTDPTGDGQATLPDGTQLDYAYDPISDSLSFRVTVLNIAPHLTDFGVNIQVNIPGVTPLESWGNWGVVQNTTFDYNRLISVWVTGTAPSTYAGTIGIADSTGVSMFNFTNIAANNMDITTDAGNHTITIEMPRKDLITNAMLGGSSTITLDVAASVGSSMAWSDDIFGGSMSIDTTIILTQPILANPPNLSTNWTVTPTLQWGPVFNATSYNYQYATEPNFVQNLVSGNVTTTFLGIGPLAGNTTYYWRVNATDGIQTTAWSAIWRFTTGQGPLIFPQPTLWLPPDNSFDQEVPQVTLNWDDVFGANQYDLEWGTDPGLSGATSHNPSNSIFTITGLNFLTTYYWKVRARNDTLVGPWSEVWNFSTRSQDLNDGIAEMSAAGGYTFFPNPTVGPVQVTRSKTNGPVVYRLIDGLGKELLAGQAVGSGFELDLSPFARGIYTLILEEEGRLYYHRLMRHE